MKLRSRWSQHPAKNVTVSLRSSTTTARMSCPGFNRCGIKGHELRFPGRRRRQQDLEKKARAGCRARFAAPAAAEQFHLPVAIARPDRFRLDAASSALVKGLKMLARSSSGSEAGVDDFKRPQIARQIFAAEKTLRPRL